MKNKFLKILSVLLFIFVASCTDDFNEINERPDALAATDVSAKFFVTDTQQKTVCSKQNSILERYNFTI